MKLVSWNIEWMNNWFVGGHKVEMRTQQISRGKILIENVPALAQRITNVLKTLDADVVTIQEGPSDFREMQLYVDLFLNDDQGNPIYDVLGGLGKGAQKVYAFVKKSGQFKNATLVKDELTLELEEEWLADIDGDLVLEEYGYTRPPLVIEGEFKGDKIRIISLHTKSKFVYSQRSLWENENRRMEFIQAAMKNRRRISAEGFRLRKYLNDVMTDNPTKKVIVTGDWNDGPGNDYFERNYLTHNITDIILGSTFYPKLLFRHALLDKVPHDELYTAIFDDFIDDIDNRKILLDHIVASPALANGIINGGVCHQEYENAINHQATTDREKFPSDHRPVFIELL